MNPLELVLSNLPGVKRNGRDWQARCPAHDDHNPSLSIAKGDDSRVLLKCHAGCETPDVVAAMGLTMADLRLIDPEEATRRRTTAQRKLKGKTYSTRDDAIRSIAKQVGGKPVMGWPYHDRDGRKLFWIVRFETQTGKTYRPISANGTGWCIGGMSDGRPLYHLADLASAKRVYVTEGEKVADAARSVGLTATTSACGSKSPEKTDWTPLADKEVVILPDNDEAGKRYADALVGLLAQLIPAPVVKVVELPGLPPAGDLVEFIQARGGDADKVRHEIEALADQAIPVELDRPRLPVEKFEPFPVGALPQPVRGFVKVSAQAIGCDPSYIALPLLSALASAIGNTRSIQLKRGWIEPAIVWTTIVGESGTMKSPALELALRPIRRRQHDAMRKHSEAMERYRDDLLRYERDLAQWKRCKEDIDPPAMPEQPVADRCWCDDTTIEALAVLLLDQWRGLLMVRDELSGWIGGFDRYTQGKGADVAKWLEMFGGRSMMVDRKASGPLYVPRAAVSIAGGIQPETLRRVLGREHRENGLAARLLLSYPPRRPKHWTEVDITPKAEAAVAAVFDRLYRLQAAAGDNGEPHPVIVPLMPEGKAAWIDFYNTHAEEHVELTGDLSAAWSKLEGYAARLALVIHFTRWAAGDDMLVSPDAVDEVSIAAGVKLSRWFGHEARRVYAMLGESDEDRRQRRLIELIRRKGGSVSPRDLMRSSQMFKTATDAEQALNELAKAGFGQWETPPTAAKGGRPTRRLRLADSVDVDKTPSKPKESVGYVNVNSVKGTEWSRSRDRVARLIRDTREDGDREQAVALRDAWQERMAICEIDGQLTGEEAEKIASEESEEIVAMRQAVG